MWIEIHKSCAGKRSMYIHISGWHSCCFGTFSSLAVIRWGRWGSRPRWHWSWWRCTCPFATPTSLWILCCDNLARKTTVRLIVPNHCRVSFYRSLHLDLPGKHNILFHLLSKFGGWFLDWLMCFLNCGRRKPFFLAILAIFKASRMLHCSSCIWPPWLAVVADMLKTYKKLVVASRVRIGCYRKHIRIRSLR